ncbi:MAG: radical SAM protein [Proteobacteria bacterium]|nr:radical SAM protein [Pseudomonadota bacterium]
MGLPLPFYKSFAKQLVRARRGEAAPFFATFFITGQCNLRCDNCFFYREYELDPYEVELPVALEVADQLGRAGVALCFLAGGEPLMHPHALEIAQGLTAAGVVPGLFTNGFPVTARNARAITETFGRLVVSIDGNEAGNDRVRGAGSYARSTSAVGLLRAADPEGPVLVKCILSRNNYEDLDGFVENMLAAGASQVSIQLDSYVDNLPPASAAGDIVRLLRRVRAADPGALFEDDEQITLAETFLTTRTAPPCTPEQLGQIAIYPDLRVSGCCQCDQPLGDLKHETLEAALARPLVRSGACHGSCRTDYQLIDSLTRGGLADLVREGRNGLRRLRGKR